MIRICFVGRNDLRCVHGKPLIVVSSDLTSSLISGRVEIFIAVVIWLLLNGLLLHVLAYNCKILQVFFHERLLLGKLCELLAVLVYHIKSFIEKVDFRTNLSLGVRCLWLLGGE